MSESVIYKHVMLCNEVDGMINDQGVTLRLVQTCHCPLLTYIKTDAGMPVKCLAEGHNSTVALCIGLSWKRFYI